MPNLQDVMKKLEEIESHEICKDEMNSLGHRIVFDIQSGLSKNIWGVHVDPRCLDANGYQIRRKPENE